jgi:hypothetical protein
MFDDFVQSFAIRVRDYALFEKGNVRFYDLLSVLSAKNLNLLRTEAQVLQKGT